MEANYSDLSLYYNGRRIPEPFCLIDMGVSSGSDIFVQLAEGAVVGHDALREQVLREIEAEAALAQQEMYGEADAEADAFGGDTGGARDEEEKDEWDII